MKGVHFKSNCSQIVQKCEFENGGTTIQIGIQHVLLNILSISLLSRVHCTAYTTISPRNILVPRVPDPFFLVDRPLFAKIIGNLCALAYTFGRRSGEIASVFRGSGSEKVVGFCFWTCSKTVADQNKSAQGRLGRLKVP